MKEFTSPFVFCKDRSKVDGRTRVDDCMGTSISSYVNIEF